jgi:hypothetical protein
MAASMPEQAEAKSERAANFSLGAAVLLFAYVGLAVLKQSDAELILPSSRFDLGGLLEKFKEGVPGGAFVTPLLQIEIPLKIFYTVGPVGLLILHAAIVLQPHLLTRAAVPLRILAIWLPPLVLGLIRWRFAPFVSSRPQPPPPTAIALEALQIIALAADIAVTAVAILWNRSLASESPFPRIVRGQLDNRASDPEIRRLASEAQKLPLSTDIRSSDRGIFYISIVAYVSFILSYFLLRQVSHLSSTDCTVGEMGRTTCRLSFAPWFWQLPVALAISAAIYLAWNIEGLLMKAELHAIARRWTRLRTLRRPAGLSASPQGEAQPLANHDPVLDTAGLIARAQFLLPELRRRGFAVDASEEQILPPGWQS